MSDPVPVSRLSVESYQALIGTSALIVVHIRQVILPNLLYNYFHIRRQPSISVVAGYCRCYRGLIVKAFIEASPGTTTRTAKGCYTVRFRF